jgi:hypothetical protein
MAQKKPQGTRRVIAKAKRPQKPQRGDIGKAKPERHQQPQEVRFILPKPKPIPISHPSILVQKPPPEKPVRIIIEEQKQTASQEPTRYYIIEEQKTSPSPEPAPDSMSTPTRRLRSRRRMKHPT